MATWLGYVVKLQACPIQGFKFHMLNTMTKWFPKWNHMTLSPHECVFCWFLMMILLQHVFRCVFFAQVQWSTILGPFLDLMGWALQVEDTFPERRKQHLLRIMPAWKKHKKFYHRYLFEVYFTKVSYILGSFRISSISTHTCFCWTVNLFVRPLALLMY